VQAQAAAAAVKAPAAAAAAVVVVVVVAVVAVAVAATVVASAEATQAFGVARRPFLEEEARVEGEDLGEEEEAVVKVAHDMQVEDEVEVVTSHFKRQLVRLSLLVVAP